MNYAIIAAGEGSRLAQEGVAKPKPLVDICGEPMIGRLINLVVPAQARRLLAILVRPQVIVARAVSQQLQRTALAGVVHHLGRIVVRGMVEAFLFRQQTVEKIQPAAAQAHHIRHLIADNRSLQRG